MKLNFTLAQLATITGGKLISATPEKMLSSFVTDSRVVSAGDGFIALKGEKIDAHQFIPSVLEKGPALVVAEKNYPLPAHTKTSFLLVDNTLRALQAIAKAHRLAHPLKVVAITGSNGKSTTKQMVRAICQCAGETIANMGNLNNQFGVPFSLLEIKPKHQFGVFELGASHKGDIAETAALTLPDVAVLTNVSAAHLAFFRDLETVYQTKTELISYVKERGTVVYNYDDAYLSRIPKDFRVKTISFGFQKGADIQLTESEKFSFIYHNKAYLWEMHLERHNKLNAAAAVGAALALGISLENIQKGLSSFTPMPMRMERITRGNTQFILDCYNANPASMANALTILAREKGPRIAVLGDMRELGETSKHFHEQLADELLSHKIEMAFLAGAEMKYAYEKLVNHPAIKVYYGYTPATWVEDLRAALKNGGTCLFKASRALNFETLFKEM